VNSLIGHRVWGSCSTAPTRSVDGDFLTATSHDRAGATEDARSYRSLGLPVLDTTDQDLTTTAEALTDLIRSTGPSNG
jgi:hypothetical protein